MSGVQNQKNPAYYKCKETGVPYNPVGVRCLHGGIHLALAKSPYSEDVAVNIPPTICGIQDTAKRLTYRLLGE